MRIGGRSGRLARGGAFVSDVEAFGARPGVKCPTASYGGRCEGRTTYPAHLKEIRETLGKDGGRAPGRSSSTARVVRLAADVELLTGGHRKAKVVQSQRERALIKPQQAESAHHRQIDRVRPQL